MCGIFTIRFRAVPNVCFLVFFFPFIVDSVFFLLVFCLFCVCFGL
jgi:hypothetical protein